MNDGTWSEKQIQWVVGQQLAGKTMYTRMMASLGARTLNIGERIRSESVSMEDITNSENPYAPQYLNSAVRAWIEDAIHDFKLSSDTLLVIDSAPKNMGQLSLVQDVIEMSSIVIVADDFEVRKIRAQYRYRTPAEMELFYGREGPESSWINHLTKVCREVNIHMVITRAVNYRIKPQIYSEGL